MTKDEAVALLGLDAEYSDADVVRRYQDLYNDYRIRLTNAPTPALKKAYQKNLLELQAASELLAPGTTALLKLPSYEPVRPPDLNTLSVRPEHRDKSPHADAGLPRSTIVALGVAALLAGLACFFAIVWFQQRETQPGPSPQAGQTAQSPNGAPMSSADDVRKAAEVERMQLEIERTRLELEKARREDRGIVEESDRAKAEAIRRAEEGRAAAGRGEVEARIEDARRARAEQQEKWEALLVDDRGNRYQGISVGVGVAAEGSVPVLTFFKSSKDLERGARFGTTVALVNRGGEAAFRFFVMHMHARDCRGVLYISPNRVAYDPVYTPQFKEDGFDVPRDTLRRLGASSDYFKIETPKRDYDFIFTAQESGGKTTWWMSPVREWAESALLDSASARRQFERAIADITAR